MNAPIIGEILLLSSKLPQASCSNLQSVADGVNFLCDFAAEDPLQGDFPEVIEEYLEHGIMKCIAFNRRGTLLAGNILSISLSLSLSCCDGLHLLEASWCNFGFF